MDQPTLAWVQIISNLGLPIALVVYFLLIKDPQQRKQAIEDRKALEEAVRNAVREQREDFERGRQKDRETSLEITRLTGEIQKQVHESLVTAINGNGETIASLEARLIEVLREFKVK